MLLNLYWDSHFFPFYNDLFRKILFLYFWEDLKHTYFEVILMLFSITFF